METAAILTTIDWIALAFLVLAVTGALVGWLTTSGSKASKKWVNGIDTRVTINEQRARAIENTVLETRADVREIKEKVSDMAIKMAKIESNSIND